MKKVVMNKNFVEKYFKGCYTHMLMWQDNDINHSGVIIYSSQCWGAHGYYTGNYPHFHNPMYVDLNVDSTLAHSNFEIECTFAQGIEGKDHKSSVMLVPETFLTMIDKINNGVKDGTITFDLEFFYNALSDVYSEHEVSAYTYLVNHGIITDAEKTLMLNTVRKMDTIEYTNLTLSLNSGQTPSLTYNYSRPMNLTKTYRIEDNLTNDDMYLFYLNHSSKRFNGITTDIIHSDRTTTFMPYSRFEYNSSSVLQIPYVAFKLSETDGDGDIKYDHLDKITHLDNIKFTISLPKEIVLQY